MVLKWAVMKVIAMTIALTSSWHHKSHHRNVGNRWQALVLSGTRDPDIYTIEVTKPHPRTVETALRHCETFKRYADQTVYAQHTVEAFNKASAFVDKFYSEHPPAATGTDAAVKRVIIDSGCGAGLSTFYLASLYPDMPIIGIDRSIARLSKNKRIDVKNNNDQTDDDDEDSNRDVSAVGSTGNRSMDNNEEGDDGGDGSDELETARIRQQGSEFEKLTNAILLQAELSDFFLLVANQTDWVVDSHYLLYPNPYPKSKHLQVC